MNMNHLFPYEDQRQVVEALEIWRSTCLAAFSPAPGEAEGAEEAEEREEDVTCLLASIGKGKRLRVHLQRQPPLTDADNARIREEALEVLTTAITGAELVFSLRPELLAIAEAKSDARWAESFEELNNAVFRMRDFE